MATDHLQFGLILKAFIVFVIDSENSEGVAVDFRLSDNVAHRHLYVGLTITGVAHHNGDLLDRNSLLREICGERTPACVGRHKAVLPSGLLLSCPEHLRVRIYAAIAADFTKDSVEGHLADFARKRLCTRAAYQEWTELPV